MNSTAHVAGSRPQSSTAQPSPARPSVTLTRRGRLVVFVAALVTVLGLGVTVSAAVDTSAKPGEVPAGEVVVIQPGETVWQIASDIHPGGDLRDTVDDIMRLNHLDSAAGLQIGTEIRLPVYE